MNIADYWNLPAEKRARVKEKAKVVPAGSNDSLFRVTGEIEYASKSFCDCEFCEGHTDSDTANINEVIAARDGAEAKEKVLNSGGYDCEDRVVWINCDISPI